MTKMISLTTPCVGICSTSIAGSVCRGCKRYAHEVIRWNTYSNEEREAVWQRLAEFRQTIIGQWLILDDEQKLRQQLQKQKIKHKADLPALALAYDLLRAGAGQIQALPDYGLRLTAKAKGMAVAAVFEQIEKEYLVLSEAHYTRYFAVDLQGTEK